MSAHFPHPLPPDVKNALRMEQLLDLKHKDVVKKVLSPMLLAWIMMQWGWISGALVFGREYLKFGVKCVYFGGCLTATQAP